MRIYDIILTEDAMSIDTALRVVAIATKNLSVMLDTAAAALREGVEWNDNGVVLPAIGPLAKWFQDNFHSGKSSNGYNLQSALHTLKSHGRYKLIALDTIEKIKPNIDKTKSESKLAMLKHLASGMADILIASENREYATIAKTIAPKFSEVSSLIAQIYAGVRDGGGRGISPVEKDKLSVEKQKIKDRGRLQGTQAVAAEAVVNQVLSSLPEKVAGEIRQAISRASNKLLALQVELKQRGL